MVQIPTQPMVSEPNPNDTADTPGANPAPPAPHGGASGLGFHIFSSLKYRNYRYLWIGTICMSGGQWIQQVTLGWLVYDMTGSSVLLGVINGLRALPFLLLSPFAGVAADRFNRRQLLIGIEAALAIAAFAMGLLVGSGLLEVWHIVAFSIASATLWAFNQPVRQSLLPSVVPRHALMNAVALASVGFQFTKILGPAVGGVLIAAFGPSGNFLVQGGCYAAVVAAIVLMQPTPNPTQGARQESVLTNLKEGLAYVRRTPIVLALMIAGLVPSICANPYQTLLPVFQKDILHLGPDALGLMLAAPGVGALLATLFLASIADTFPRKGLLLLASLFLEGIFLILFSRSETIPTALLALAGVGAFQILFAATTTTLLQLIVPDELRGRVMSIHMLDFGLSPIGSLFAGLGTHYVGAPLTVTVMGIIVILLAVVVTWRMPALRSARV